MLYSSNSLCALMISKLVFIILIFIVISFRVRPVRWVLTTVKIITAKTPKVDSACEYVCSKVEPEEDSLFRFERA